MIAASGGSSRCRRRTSRPVASRDRAAAQDRPLAGARGNPRRVGHDVADCRDSRRCVVLCRDRPTGRCNPEPRPLAGCGVINPAHRSRPPVPARRGQGPLGAVADVRRVLLLPQQPVGGGSRARARPRTQQDARSAGSSARSSSPTASASSSTASSPSACAPRRLLAIGMLGSAALNVAVRVRDRLLLPAVRVGAQRLRAVARLAADDAGRGELVPAGAARPRDRHHRHRLSAARQRDVRRRRLVAADALGWRGALFVPAALLALAAVHMLLTLDEAPEPRGRRPARRCRAADRGKRTSSRRWPTRACGCSRSRSGCSTPAATASSTGASPSAWRCSRRARCVGASSTRVLPAGGIVGTLVAGWATDRFFGGRRDPGHGRDAGRARRARARLRRHRSHERDRVDRDARADRRADLRAAGLAGRHDAGRFREATAPPPPRAASSTSSATSAPPPAIKSPATWSTLRLARRAVVLGRLRVLGAAVMVLPLWPHARAGTSS